MGSRRVSSPLPPPRELLRGGEGEAGGGRGRLEGPELGPGLVLAQLPGEAAPRTSLTSRIGLDGGVDSEASRLGPKNGGWFCRAGRLSNVITGATGWLLPLFFVFGRDPAPEPKLSWFYPL